jgi:SAM-dependent methyltransferase
MVGSQRAYQQTYYDDHYAGREDVVREQLAHPLFKSFQDRLAGRILDLSEGASRGDAGVLRVFEPGCGEGLLGSALLRVAGERGIGVDYAGGDLSRSALELARPALGDHLEVGDAAELVAALPDASRDLIIIKNLLHHLDDPASLLRESARAVGPKGRVAIVEARLGCPQFWVFSVLAPKREKYYFYGAQRNRKAIRDAGLEIDQSTRFSWLPYELAFHVRFGTLRNLLSTDDPSAIGRFSAVDDRLTSALPWLSSYVVWVTRQR